MAPALSSGASMAMSFVGWVAPDTGAHHRSGRVAAGPDGVAPSSPASAQLHLEVLREVKHEPVVKRDLLTLLNVPPIVGHAQAVWDIAPLYVQALRGVVAGMQANTDSHCGRPSPCRVLGAIQ